MSQKFFYDLENHAQEPLGIFKPEKVEKIVKALVDINEAAQAA